MKKRIWVNVRWSVILAAGWAAPVLAHHSFPGYDMSKTLSAPATLAKDLGSLALIQCAAHG